MKPVVVNLDSPRTAQGVEKGTIIGDQVAVRDVVVGDLVIGRYHLDGIATAAGDGVVSQTSASTAVAHHDNGIVVSQSIKIVDIVVGD